MFGGFLIWRFLAKSPNRQTFLVYGNIFIILSVQKLCSFFYSIFKKDELPDLTCNTEKDRGIHLNHRTSGMTCVLKYSDSVSHKQKVYISTCTTIKEFI